MDNLGNTPLKLATRLGDYQAIELLLKCGCCSPKQRPFLISGKTIAAEDFELNAFELAIKIGDPKSIKLFLEQNMRERRRKWKQI